MKESVLKAEIYVDGDLFEEALMPTAFSKRKHEISWKYNMPQGLHNVMVVLKNPMEGYNLRMNNVIVYGPEPDYKEFNAARNMSRNYLLV